MPRNPEISQDEYDRMHWQILHADARWSSVRLAQDYGIPAKTVSRWRREPWTCGVKYVPCKWCGELVTSSTSSLDGNKRKYHPECYRLQRAEWNREASRKRLYAMDDWHRMWALEDIAEIGREVAQKRYEESLPSAVNNRGPWSAEDEAWLVENYRHPDILAIAKHLGRTTKAVRRKYEKLTQ